MPRISLAMIVKDEEKVIGRCLDSVKDVVDEIVIVDTGSTDRTVEIAKRYTHRIYRFKWINDFSAARNYSFQQCTGDWIIWLDADDVIKPADADKIRNLDLSDKEIIICPYVYFHDEFDNSSLTVPRERIIKRSLGLKWEQPIHEYIRLLSAKQYISDIEIHHYREGGTAERNLFLLEHVVKGDAPGSVQPDVDPRNIYYLGKEYHDVCRYDEAIVYLEKYVDLRDGKFRFWEDVYQAYYRLAQCYQHKKDDLNFKRCLFESLKIEDRRAEPCCLMGEWYMNRNEWSRAIQWYKTALAIQRPKELLSSYRPMYYTWLPCLQIAVCAYNLQDYEQAREYNEKFAQYCPDDSRASFNRNLINIVLKEQKLKDGKGKKLNLGCGDKAVEGYVNVDVFQGKIVDEVFEFDDIPYKDNTISAIYSEHALEHVGRERGEKALKEWYRVLKSGGELNLKIPDFELCCRYYLSDENKLWYKQTIYGYQKSLFGEEDEFQFHKWGYSKKDIEELLKTSGFSIETIENYDGFRTPSINIVARKPASALKVGWVCGNTEREHNAAQTRLRVINVNRWLQSQGYQSELVDYPKIIDENYDIAIVGKGFDEGNLNWVKKLKNEGKTVYCDICEDLIDWPYVNEILSACDRVICCSRKLEERVKPLNSNTTVIEESWEA